ncbi:hypothetical protein C8R43DRAFT_184305 [Mycena crocata]|nr:hypothetical protein C8R43DRAFT_184305 [Mycena crocata]
MVRAHCDLNFQKLCNSSAWALHISSSPTMSTRRPPNATTPSGSSSSATAARASKPMAPSDWLGNSLLAAKIVTSAAECAPFPYLKGVFGTGVVLLETVEKVKKNRENLKELCENTVEIITIVRDQIVAHGDSAATKFKSKCNELESLLREVCDAITPLNAKPRGIRAHLKEFVKSSSNADTINEYQQRIRNLRDNFGFMATIDTNFQVGKVLTVLSPNLLAPVPAQNINSCPPASRIFQGRTAILVQMQQYFSTDSGNQNILLLYGLGGAGKTQIAFKFIEQSSSHFSDVFMVDTSTTDTIDTGLKNIAIAKNSGTTAQDAFLWLVSKTDNWLLFFDNADDPKINLNKFFPQCKHGNIIITSRNPGLRVYSGSHFLVSDMEEDDAVNLLLRSASEGNTDDKKKIAAEIVQALYYLPLAIIQAGAFISRSGNLHTYLELYTQNRAQLLSERPAQSHDDYSCSVYTTWQISFDRLSEPAAMFMQFCSFLHYKGISEEIFIKASGYQCDPSEEEELQQAFEFLSQFRAPGGGWDSLRFINITNEIREYSLMTFDPVDQFSIHPLVHAWAKSIVTDEEVYHAHVCAILGMAICEVPKSEEELISLRWVPHLDSVLYREPPPNPDFKPAYGRLYHAAKRNNDALTFRLAVLEKQRQTLGVDHPETLWAMGNLAVTYSHLGQVKEAEELEVVVLEKCRKILGNDHPNTLLAMNNLASTYSHLGQVKEAEELEVVVLEKRRKILGNDHPNTLLAMNNLASTYSYLGQIKEAEELRVLVFEKHRKILGDDHPDTLQAMGNLARTYSDLGQAKEAEELEVVVLEKRRKILGNDHPNTLLAMNNLASTYSYLGQIKEAEELRVLVFEKHRKILGNDHPDTLLAMANLARTYIHLDQGKEAEELEAVVLEKHRKILGDDHPDTLLAMGNLASTYSYLGQIKEAEELTVLVFEKHRKILGDDHPNTLCAMGNLARTYSDLGRVKEAEELEVVLLEKRRKILGDDHPNTLCAMGNLARTYSDLGRVKEAAELEVVLLEKRRKILGDDHPHTLLAMANLANTYYNLEKFQDAEELQVVVLRKRRDVLGEDHPDTKDAMEDLRSTYQALGKSNDVHELNLLLGTLVV